MNAQLVSMLKTVRREEKGMILPMVLVLLALGLLLVTPTLGYGYTSVSASGITEDRAEELYAADAGLEEALYWLTSGHEDNANWTWDDVNGGGGRDEFALNGTAVNVTIDPLPSLGANYYLVTSTATGPEGQTTVLSQVWAAPGAHDGLPGGTYEGDVYVDGDGTMMSHDQIIGNVVVSGDFTMNAQTAVDGDVSIHGDYVQHAHTTVTGNLCAYGTSIEMKAQADLQGDIYLELGDGDSAVIIFQGQAEAGDIYIAVAGTDASATITITLNNKDVVGDIFVMPEITLVQDFKAGSTHGTVDENWTPTELPPIECPGIGVGGAVIQTYEII